MGNESIALAGPAAGLLRWAAFPLCVILLLCAAGCSTANGGQVNEPIEHSFSFEDDLADWTIRALDVEVSPGDEIDWSIETSDVRATDGEQSVELFADNRTDACKIWMERAFDLTPNQNYSVEISFDFATNDFGDFNLWTLIAGASPVPPVLAEDLPYQDETSSGPDDTGYQWLEKTYTVNARASADGKLYVILGVWGTWETPRTYYLDNLRLEFTAIP